MLIEHTLFGVNDKINIAIERLKQFEPEEGYYLAFSGGKDSCVIKALADMSGVKYDAHYNMTTIDPPELVQFIKDVHSDIIIDRPEKSFFQEMQYRGFPQRQNRWCCSVLKENGGENRFVITGVRWAESYKRSKRRMVESCYRDAKKRYLNVVIDWAEEDIWEFIKSQNIPYCKLYDEGWKRIGCLFCPMSGPRRKMEIERYPKFRKAFELNFEKLYQKRKEAGAKSISRWGSGKEMFEWWINEDRQKEDPDQTVLFE